MSVKIILDESKYGNTGDPSKPAHCFYLVEKSGKEKFITLRHCEGDVLVAVSKDQYKQWKNQNIISRLANE